MESALDIGFFLEILKTALFIAIFLVSTNYLIPKGVLFYSQWKQKGLYRDLKSSITFWAGGLFLLIYLTATAIIQHAIPLWSSK